MSDEELQPLVTPTFSSFKKSTLTASNNIEIEQFIYSFTFYYSHEREPQEYSRFQFILVQNKTRNLFYQEHDKIGLLTDLITRSKHFGAFGKNFDLITSRARVSFSTYFYFKIFFYVYITLFL